jgi:hypothetical protein
MAIDFTRYNPPGVYAEDLGGPQLAVRSTVPTAVAIFGQGVGYRIHRESVKIPQDTTVDGALVAVNSLQLAKSGIKVVDFDIDAFAAVNVDLAAPGASIGGVTLSSNDYVQLYAQDKASENGLYRWNGATTALTPILDTFKVVNPTTGESYVRGRDYTIVRLNVGDDTSTTVPGRRDDVYALKRVRGTVIPTTTATTNINVASPGATIAGRAMVAGDFVQLSGQTVSGQNGLYQWNGATTALTPVSSTTGTTLEERQVVQVSYRYTDPDYYGVYSLYDYDDVRDQYGEPFDASGAIQSEITLAAKFAFMNGASTVLTCAVDREAVYPAGSTNAGQTKALSECYQDALDRLSDESQIAVVVPASGNPEYFDMVRAHVGFQSQQRYERRAILGIDGSVARTPSSTRIELVKTLRSDDANARRLAVISPSQFDHFAPELGRKIKLGGQFVAAAVAGKSVSMIASMPLTRKNIVGFDGPTTEDTGREGEKNLESDNGLMVIEKTRNNRVQVRHGVTTDPTELLTREWSIIGQQDVMVYRVRDFLDADGLVGMPIYDTTLIQVKASAESALESLVRDQIIVGYQNLKVRQIATMPEVIEVRYEWKPAYPLNYILVRYSVAVMTGDVTVSEGTN